MSTWNRAPGKTAGEVNLDGAPYGFRVTGDAAWDSDSTDFAMFSEAGNLAVAAMVKTARLKCRTNPEHEVAAWIEAEKERLAADTGTYPFLPHLPSGIAHKTMAGHGEIYDTMVRETIAYALDEAWQEAYGHRFGEGD